MKTRNSLLGLALFILSCPGVTLAEHPRAGDPESDIRARMGEMKDEVKFHKMIDETEAIYQTIVKGPHGEVPSVVLKNARCIAVIPSVVTAALVVGGSRGSGLASCKTSTSSWSQPAPISLTQGSIGLQAGAKSADLVLYFVNKTAEEALKNGEVSIGSDVSAVGGTYASQMDIGNAGVVAYSRSAGMFAGASISGSKIRRDSSYLASYYGKDVDYSALLEGRTAPDSSGYAEKLTKLFP